MALTKNKNIAPSIVNIKYAFAYDIIDVRRGSDDNHKIVVFKPGKSWNEMYSSPVGMQFEEPPKNTDAGTLYEQKLSKFFPGDDESNISDFADIENRPLLALFFYDNGTARFIGSIGNPAEISLSYSTSRGGTIMTFTCNSQFRAYFIE